MSQRWPIKTKADASILRQALQFPTSKRTAKNRIFKVALTECLSSYDEEHIQNTGLPTQKLNNVYSKWGVGGFGMVFTGNIFVDPKHMEYRGNSVIHPTLNTEERKDAFKKSTEVMKKDGALAIAQLNHAGRLTPINFNEHPFAPSGIKHTPLVRGFLTYGEPKELTKEQIKSEVVDNFVYAAKYCQEIGFDGVELHAAYGYLLSEFLTSNTNKRTDEYGGSIENRARVIKEIYETIRKEIQPTPEFVVGIKVNTHEFQNTEFKDDDVIKFCQEFDKYGFDFIELTGGTVEEWSLNYSKMRETTKNREAYFQEQAQNIKPSVKNAVVLLSGGLRTVYGMADVISNNIADGVGLGKPSMAEPDVAKKLLSNQYQSVVYNHLEDDYQLYVISCMKQLNEAAATTLEETGGVLTSGITDFSDKEIAEEFKLAQSKGA